MKEMLSIHRIMDEHFKLLLLQRSSFGLADHKLLDLLFIFSGLLPVFFLNVFRLFKTLKNVHVERLSTYK